MGAKCITESIRHEVAVYLLQLSKQGKLTRGDISAIALRFNVKERTIINIWKVAKAPRLVGQALDVKSKRMGNKNTKRLLPDVEHIKGLAWGKRDTIVRVAENTGVSVGTVHSWVTEGLPKPHTIPLHPQLTDANKYNRLKHALKCLMVEHVEQDWFDLNAIPMTKIKFCEMSNIIHMDEKWFYITYDGHMFYIVDGEELPYRSCQSKRFITKTMFMCAVCRPIYGEHGELIFDGKIGMFSFTKQQLAARSSRNRLRGTMETNPIDSITKQVTRECIIEQVIPAVKSKWPEGASQHIFIQQDNARPRIQNNDPALMAVANTDGNNIFLMLQSVMIEIMLTKGHNNFAIPHMEKSHLAFLGILPRNLEVNEVLVRGASSIYKELVKQKAWIT